MINPMQLSKVDIINIGFNPIEYNAIVKFLLEKKNRKKYICFPDLYNILRANENKYLREIYNNSSLTLPDGKPSQFLLKLKGYKSETISGYWLCKKLLRTNLSHYFYGSLPENLILLEKYFRHNYPNAKILGFKSPPILSEYEIFDNKKITSDLNEIKLLKPDIIWIGISSPKQDFLMDIYKFNREGTVMIGVGAVFDYFAGNARMGPEWIKKIGLRWLYQLIISPRRYYYRLFYIAKTLPKTIFNNLINKDI